jgi:predicted DCC family thiol-disulfide oxidoreductase YuxK
VNLIFFDSTCPLCQRSVQKIQEADAGKIFAFYPLTSEKAKELLPEKLLKGDTIVLLENGQKTWIRAKAIFRILGLLGSKWGWLVHVPGLNLFYRIIAHNRHFLK